MKIAIIGAGGHGKVVADAVRADGKHELVGFFDDDGQLIGRNVAGAQVLDRIAAWRSYPVDGLILAIGNNRIRQDVMLRLVAENARLASVIHPSAIVSGAVVENGTVLMAGVVVNIEANIGKNVILNTGAIVEHDCVVGAHVHIAPGSCLAGGVTIGEGAFIGMGSRILPEVHVGAWSIVGAGAVVVRDVPDGATVVGIPARRLR